MNASTPTLIAHFRRRIVASAWLFAFLVLAKAVVVTACLTDDIDVSSSLATTSTIDSAVQPALGADSDSDGGCWHAGSTGCHCACAHGSALLADSLTTGASHSGPTLLPPIAPREFAAPRSATLRPPIA